MLHNDDALIHDMHHAHGRGFACWSQESLAQIEKNADAILQDVGIQIKGDADTLQQLATLASCRIVGTADTASDSAPQRVYVDGGELREIIRNNAPRSFTHHARNAARSVEVGGGQSIFAPVYGPPRVLHEDGTSTLGSLDDYQMLTRIVHEAPAFANSGAMMCAVHGIAEHLKPLKMAHAHLCLSDKPFMGTVASPAAVDEVIALTSIAFGKDIREQCCLLHLINSTPPLTYQANPLQCLRQAAHAGQGCIITSYMMMGATAPVTVSGALAIGYAEVMLGLALAQLWRPATPVISGIYAVPFSMHSMLPVYGDPISILVQSGGIQLAHRLGVPARGDGGVTSAKLDDAQAGLEGSMATTAAVHAGADFILHSGGWLESGRCVSVAKLRREAAAIKHHFLYTPSDATDATAAAKAAPPVALDESLCQDMTRYIHTKHKAASA